MIKRVGQAGAETCREGELVGQWAAQSWIGAVGEDVAAYVDEGQGVGAEQLGGRP